MKPLVALLLAVALTATGCISQARSLPPDFQPTAEAPTVVIGRIEMLRRDRQPLSEARTLKKWLTGHLRLLQYQGRDEPLLVWEAAGRITVVQKGEQVRFTFESWAPGETAWSKSRANDLSVSRVDNDSRTFLWSVHAQLGSGEAAGEITYGVVPPGFVQTNPKEGAPPALQPGTTYAVSAGMLGGTTRFVYQDPQKMR